MTKYTYVNVQTGEVSRDYDTVEAWELCEGEFQFAVTSKAKRIMVCNFSSLRGAWRYLVDHPDFEEVSIIRTEALL